jgi:hypothetical protein
MSRNNLVDRIEQLRQEMECCGRIQSLSSKELLRLSERLDRLISAYLRGGKNGKKNPPG